MSGFFLLFGDCIAAFQCRVVVVVVVVVVIIELPFGIVESFWIVVHGVVWFCLFRVHFSFSCSVLGSLSVCLVPKGFALVTWSVCAGFDFTHHLRETLREREIDTEALPFLSF